jgi:hypothetical protein
MAESCGVPLALSQVMKTFFVVLIPMLGIAACGGSVVDGVNNGGDAGGGSDGGTTGDGGISSGCPATEPTSGACAPNGLHCEYGTSNGACENPSIDCQAGQWTEPPPVPGPACLPSTGCPSDESQVQVGADCGDQDLECNFPTGRCTCAEQGYGGLQPYNPDGGPIPKVWECEQPANGCSATRPRLGSSCSQEGQSCMYGNCDMPDSIGIQCTSGVWVNAPYACAG